MKLKNLFLISLMSLLFSLPSFAMRDNNSTILNLPVAGVAGTSLAVDTGQYYTGSFQAVLTGTTVAGTILLQGSNDTNALIGLGQTGSRQPINWNNIPNGTISLSLTNGTGVVTSATSLITFSNLNYRWLRAEWLNVSGTGAVTLNGNLLGL